MRRLVSNEAALAADRAAESEFGYPAWMLMEEAGIRLQDRLESLEASGAWPPGTVAYLVGSGNNGGDAWVMARQAWLRGRRSLVVIEVFPPSSASCRLQADWARRLGLPVLDWSTREAAEALRTATVWVDGLWGTGLQSPLREDRSRVLGNLETLRHEASRPVVAVDLASGLWEGRAVQEPALTARWTLSAGPIKESALLPANRPFGGTLVEILLAFPVPAVSRTTLWEASDLADLLPLVSRLDHKGRRGHVALAGGSTGMTGALVLAARSAAAAGAGLVSLAVDDELVGLVAPQVPAFQVRTASDALGRQARYDALVVGPGWGRRADRKAWLASLWSTPLPLVLDADALAAWASLERPSRAAPTVVTPHPGEFLALGVGPATVEAAGRLAQDTGVVVVLKGAATWILAPDGRRAVWDGREPTLGTGGSGDCLAGVVGALLAVGQPAFEAAVAAVALHGAAGQQLAQTSGWYTADQLPEGLARTALACRTASGPL